MKRMHYTEIARPGYEHNLIKSVLEHGGISDFEIKNAPEIIFKVTEYSTNEKVEVYITREDLINYFQNGNTSTTEDSSVTEL